jgi:hypothetical protein
MRLQLGLDGQEIPFLLKDAAGNRLTGLTLEEIDVTIWKAGFIGFGQTVHEHPSAELGDGWYVYTAGEADLDVEGPCLLRAEHASSGVTTECELDVAFVAPPTPATARPIGREGF